MDVSVRLANLALISQFERKNLNPSVRLSVVTIIDGEVISIIDGRTSGGTVRRDRDTQVGRKNGVSLWGEASKRSRPERTPGGPSR